MECLKGIEFAASHQPICLDIFGLSSPWCHAFDVQYLGFDSFVCVRVCVPARELTYPLYTPLKVAGKMIFLFISMGNVTSEEGMCFFGLNLSQS